MSKPYLVLPDHAPRGVDLLELVGKQYAADPSFALQWVAAGDAPKYEATGWQRVKESGVDVVVMGQQLLRKDRAVVDAEHQVNRDKAQKNFDDAVEKFAGQGGTVKSKWDVPEGAQLVGTTRRWRRGDPDQ